MYWHFYHRVARPVLVLGLLCSARSGWSLDPRLAVTQYVHDIWKREVGLPVNLTTAVAQTPDGYIWVGTQNGLSRFNGFAFRTFEDADISPTVISSPVQTLRVGNNGELWVGTSGAGLLRFAHGRFQQFKQQDGLPGDTVTALLVDTKGTLWVGCTEGLATYDGKRFRVVGFADGKPPGNVFALAQTSNGDIWAGNSPFGLHRLSAGRWSSVARNDGLLDGSVWSLLSTPDGELWVGTDRGLQRRRGDAFETWLPQRGTQVRVPVYSLLRDRDQSLWIGASDALYRALPNSQPDRLQRYSAEQGLSGPGVSSLFEDREGSLWVTTRSGLNRFGEGKFVSLTKSEGLPGDATGPVFQDESGDLWTGIFGGGLARFHDGLITSYTRKDGLTSNNVMAIASSRAGGLWIGTYGGGVVRFDKRIGRAEPITGAAGELAGQEIFTLLEDHKGRLWAGGANSGISVLDQGRWSTFTTRDGLASNTVVNITELRNGDLLFATDQGLSRLKDGHFVSLREANGLPNKFAFFSLEDADGTIWIGTNGGLARWKGGQVRSIRARDGLSDNAVYSIVDGGDDHLWMSGNKGISRVRKSDLNAFADGLLRHAQSETYGVHDGLKGGEGIGGVQPAAWRARNGTLWFPTAHGLVSALPQKFSVFEHGPPLVIEEVMADGHILARHPDLVLPAGNDRLTFRYAALTWTAVDHIRYRYKLEGFDSNWIEAGSERAATYTRLPPGRFRFRVESAVNNSSWSAANSSWIQQEPHFYQTFWFALLLFGLLGAGLYLIMRIRVQRLEQRHALVLGERTRIAREIHDTYLQGFTGTVLSLEGFRRGIAKNDAQSQSRMQSQLSEILEKAERCLREARDAIWDLRAAERADPGHSFFADLEADIEAVLKAAGVTVHCKVAGLPCCLNGSAQSEAKRIMVEAASNVARHANATAVHLQLTSERGGARLTLKDNGKGFNVAEPALERHFGLQGMRERSSAISGKLQISSLPGRGTTVELWVPEVPGRTGLRRSIGTKLQRLVKQ